MTRNEAGHGANFCKEPDLEKERKNTVLKTIKKISSRDNEMY